MASAISAFNEPSAVRPIRSVVLATLVLAAASTSPRAVADDFPAGAEDFFAFNCLDCHSGSEGEAGLDLTSLGTDLSDPQVFHRWVRIFDRVNDGEMPPADYGQLDDDEKRAFLDGSGDWLVHAQEQQRERRGRVRGRRLTNHQLERTLQDLLAIDIPLATLMSEEPRHEGFTGIADHQSISHFHLESHLSVVDAALDEAFRRAADDGSSWSRDYEAKDVARSNPKKRNRDPEMRNGKAVVWNSGLIFYGRISSSRVKESGWYRVNFTASAVKKPKGHGVWCTVRTGPCVSSAPLLAWVGAFEAQDEPQDWTFETWIPKGEMLEIRPADINLKRGRFKGGQVGVGEGEPQDVPGLAIHRMRMERIHPGGTVDEVRESLFGDLPIKADSKSATVAFDGDVSADALKSRLHQFATDAFRRPLDGSEFEPFAALLQDSLDAGVDPIDALRSAYRAVLCSPRFLYFTEPVGELDSYAIANRLSYLIGNSMPDERLMTLAADDQLRDPKVLREQVDRLLETDRGSDFVRDFADQWLDMSKIGFTEPERKLYRNFDIVVQDGMLQETLTFLQEMLDRDASVGQIIDSKHTYLQSRLARYYGIDGVEGDEVRKVKLDDDSHRGGLLAHGSILKVTANGNDTSPVLRGVWVSERILGQPIAPPPANVPAVEPDIRGATTIRELLEKHKADPSCASCHVKIDPPGYALENFDAAGRWRDKYVQMKGGRPRPAAEVDSSYTLPDGRDFSGFHEFRELLSEDVRPIARNVAEKLLIYGTGATVSFADRHAVDGIVDDAADQEYGFRSLLHAVVTSPTFLTK